MESLLVTMYLTMPILASDPENDRWLGVFSSARCSLLPGNVILRQLNPHLADEVLEVLDRAPVF